MVPVVAGLATIRWARTIDRLRSSVLIFDAGGLALFAVAGTLKALDFGVNPLPAVLLGMLTGIGGGIVRDVLVSEVPAVMRSELYAVAALTGASVVVAGRMLQLPSSPLAIAGALVCFALRFAAIRRGWHLPLARSRDSGTET